MRNALLALVAGAMLAAPAALAQQRGTGLVYLEPERYRSIPLAPPVALTGVPAEFDMSKDFPTPGDQGQQGSCVGWAVGYALKSFQERRERNWTNWDDTKRMSPAFVYNQIKVGGCGDGARIADALGLLSSDGSAAWADQPYRLEDCDQLPSALTKQNAAMNRIAGWFRVNPQDITVVKAHLSAGMPIVIGMGVDQSFQQLQGAEVWTGNPGSRADGHAMVIVGYSDKRNAVKVINSWGTGWGDGGFGWIDYEAFRRAVREAYVAQDVVLPVGVAERKENPYSLARGTDGPSFFGLRIGMSKDQAISAVTREHQLNSFSRDGRSQTQIGVPVDQRSGSLISGASFQIDDGYDFLHSATLHFDNVNGKEGLQLFSLMPELRAGAEALSRSLVSKAKWKGDGGFLSALGMWEVPGGICATVAASHPQLTLADILKVARSHGTELDEALERIGARLDDQTSAGILLKRGPDDCDQRYSIDHVLALDRAEIRVTLKVAAELSTNVYTRLADVKENCSRRTSDCNASNVYRPYLKTWISLQIEALRKSSSTLD